MQHVTPNNGIEICRLLSHDDKRRRNLYGTPIVSIAAILQATGNSFAHMAWSPVQQSIDGLKE